MSRYDGIHFVVIQFVHETLYGLFVNPYTKLTAAGLKRGQKVLEVGCGPGFFTIPAARIVGDHGRVYALDINPFAVDHVRHKIEREGPKNAEVIRADASATGLPDKSVDLALLFSVIHSLQNLNEVLLEMHRVLKENGLLSIQSRWPEEKVLNLVTANGLFDPMGKVGGVLAFKKVPT